MDDYQRGIATLEALLGRERADAISGRFAALSPAFEQEAVAVVFGRTWPRQGIDAKTRALCSIGILAALGRQNALRIVADVAGVAGASRGEIDEVLLQVAIYAGYPAALDALAALAEPAGAREAP